jgi:hypothetical protein
VMWPQVQWRARLSSPCLAPVRSPHHLTSLADTQNMGAPAATQSLLVTLSCLCDNLHRNTPAQQSELGCVPPVDCAVSGLSAAGCTPYFDHSRRQEHHQPTAMAGSDPIFVTRALGRVRRTCSLSMQAPSSWYRKATVCRKRWNFYRGSAMSWLAASARTIPSRETRSGALRAAAQWTCVLVEAVLISTLAHATTNLSCAFRAHKHAKLNSTLVKDLDDLTQCCAICHVPACHGDVVQTIASTNRCRSSQHVLMKIVLYTVHRPWPRLGACRSE